MLTSDERLAYSDLLKDFTLLVKSLKRDWLIYKNEEGLCQLTVGADTLLDDWSYQTVDNSFTGGAYGYPHWAVVSFGFRNKARDIAEEILDELLEVSRWRWDENTLQMDDELREKAHKLAPCTRWEFVERYRTLHKEKYGTCFQLS